MEIPVFEIINRRMERFARHSRTNFPLEDDGTIQNFGMCRRSGLSDLKRRFPSSERMRQMSPFCGALSLSLSREDATLFIYFLNASTPAGEQTSANFSRYLAADSNSPSLPPVPVPNSNLSVTQ